MAATKGLLIDGLEKQNIQSEKIGLNSEKLSEISRTIALEMIDRKNRKKLFPKISARIKNSKISHNQMKAASHLQPEVLPKSNTLTSEQNELNIRDILK